MASTLLHYLLPLQEYDGTKIPQIEIVNDPESLSNKLTPLSFHPALPLLACIPFQVVLIPQLPAVIRSHLEVIFKEEYSQIVNVFASVDVKGDYSALRRFCRRHQPNVAAQYHDKERFVSNLAAHLADLVQSIFQDLKGQQVISKPQVRTVNSAVKVDWTYETYDTASILWKDKAIPVFYHHIHNIITRLTVGKKLFSDPLNTMFLWQGAESILAKVTVFSSLAIQLNQQFCYQIAYQALEKPEKKCRWAVVYGGTSYMVIFMDHVVDAAGMDRVAMYCSSSISLYHDTEPIQDQDGCSYTLPIWSVIISMLLTTHGRISQEDLIEQLRIARPETPKEFPPGWVEAAGGMKLSSRKGDDKRVCISRLILLHKLTGPAQSLQLLTYKRLDW